MKLAVMGGTFNPIHVGHLISAADVAAQLGFEKVLFIPSAKPPHKSSAELIEAEHRYRMVRLAIEGNPLFEPSRLEIDRPGPSFAVDTIRLLYEQYGSATELYWVIGADMLVDFHIWRDADRLLEECRFVATTRPGYDLSGVPADLRARVQIVTIPDVGISSTDVRVRIREGRCFRYLVPECVFEYIHEHRLYMRSERCAGVSSAKNMTCQ